MIRTNLEGIDVTDIPLKHDPSDRVEMSGEEFDRLYGHAIVIKNYTSDNANGHETS